MHEFFCVDILCVSKIDDITALNKMKLKKLFLMVKYWAQNRRQKTFALFKQKYNLILLSMTNDRVHLIFMFHKPMNILLSLFIAVSNSALYLNEPHLNEYYPWLICQIDKVCIP